MTGNMDLYRDRDKAEQVYLHGGDIYSEAISLDFSVNTAAGEMPEEIAQAVWEERSSWSHYPDERYRRLRQKISAYYQRRLSNPHAPYIEPEWIVPGNGAADILYHLCFALRPGRVLLTAPSFLDYEKSARACGAAVSFFMPGAELDFSLSAALAALEKCIARIRPDMLILGNPNNPNGLALSCGDLHRIASCCEKNGCVLIVDECFNWFVKNRESHSILSLLAACRHVVCLQALTKIMSMPGLRAGYGIIPGEDIRTKLASVRQAWPLSAPAQSALLAGLAYEERTGYGEKTAADIAARRGELAAALRNLGLRVFPSMANFVLWQALPEEEIAWKQELKKKGILIRDCGNYPGLTNGFYRVSVRSSADNRKLISAMQEIRRSADR